MADRPIHPGMLTGNIGLVAVLIFGLAAIDFAVLSVAFRGGH